MAQAASPSLSKTITLKAADGELFEVETSIAKEMKTVEIFIDDDAKAFVIPLPKVSSRDLVKIIEYCKQRRAAANAKDFDAEFAEALNNKELLSLIAAANYLNMPDMLDLLSQCIGDRVQNTNFTKEEEANLREEMPWAFERGVDTAMNEN